MLPPQSSQTQFVARPANGDAAGRNGGEGSAAAGGNGSPHKGGALVPFGDGHALGPIVLPAGVPVPGQSPDTGPDVMGLLHALRRRWMLAVGLGLVASVTVALLTWFFVPVSNEVAAYVKLESRKPTLIESKTNQNLSHQEFGIFKNSQAATITNAIVLNRALGKPGIQDLRPIAAEEDPLGWLLEDLRVGFPQDADIMEVRLSGEHPEDLAKLVNAIVDTYLEEAHENEQRAKRELVSRLDSNKRSRDDEIDRKYQRFLRLAETLQTPDVENAGIKQRLTLESLSRLRQEYSHTQSQISEQTMAINRLKLQMKMADEIGPDEMLIEQHINADPVMQQKTATVNALRDNLNYLRQFARNDDDPRVAQLAQQIKDAEDDIENYRLEVRPYAVEAVRSATLQNTDQLKLELQFAEDTKKMLEDDREAMQNEIATTESELRTMGRSTAELERLRAELDADRAMVQTLATQLQVAEAEVSSESRVSLFQRAEAPEGSRMQIKLIVVGFASVLGFLLPGVAIAFVEFQARKLNSAIEVAEGLGIRLIGSLPSLRGQGRKKAATQFALYEAVDAIRTSLMLNAHTEATRVVMFTSADDGEGKTTAATQLAASLARTGRRTLLIDGSLRNPTAHLLFEQPLDPGFCEVLRGEVDVQDVVRPTRAPGLWMISAGHCDQMSIQALAKDAVTGIFDALRADFDFIVIDTSPVLATADTLLFGRHVDAAVLSVLRDVSQTPRIREAYDRMEAVGIRVLGAIFQGETRVRSSNLRALPASIERREADTSSVAV